MARYNVSLPEYVVAEVDKRASELGISRSAFITAAIQFKFQYDDMMAQVPKMIMMLHDVRSGKMTVDEVNDVLKGSATDVAFKGGEA